MNVFFSKYKILPEHQILPKHKRKMSKKYSLTRNFGKFRADVIKICLKSCEFEERRRSQNVAKFSHMELRLGVTGNCRGIEKIGVDTAENEPEVEVSSDN